MKSGDAAFEEARAINRDLLALQQRAYANEMILAGRAINRAINVCGWEIEGNVDEASKAAVRI